MTEWLGLLNRPKNLYRPSLFQRLAYLFVRSNETTRPLRAARDAIQVANPLATLSSDELFSTFKIDTKYQYVKPLDVVQHTYSLSL